MKLDAMKSEISESNDVMNVMLPESIGINEVKELQNSIITKGDFGEVIIDGSNVSLISSFGLQFLLSLKILTKNRGSKVTMVKNSDYLIRIINNLSISDQLVKD